VFRNSDVSEFLSRLRRAGTNDKSYSAVGGWSLPRLASAWRATQAAAVIN